MRNNELTMLLPTGRQESCEKTNQHNFRGIRIDISLISHCDLDSIQRLNTHQFQSGFQIAGGGFD